MINQLLITIYRRDLDKLKAELNAYSDEEQIWQIQNDISNSAGNLTMHLIGNLNHFIGATLGNTGYLRKRDDEFTLKNTPRNELLRSIDDTIAVISDTLSKIKDNEMEKPFPLFVIGNDNSTCLVLIHLIAHLDYHLGQINYHRRIIAR